MGSLAAASTDEVLDGVLTARGGGFVDVRDDMRAAHDAAWQAIEPRLLELCRVRMATLLGCDAEAKVRTDGAGVEPERYAAIPSWPTDPRFDACERACLAFAEHFVIDVASLDDHTAGAVREHLGDQGLQDFASALLVIEQRIRLRLVWDRLLGGD
jgi:alkylhydroperoxidase family enzyme